MQTLRHDFHSVDNNKSAMIISSVQVWCITVLFLMYVMMINFVDYISLLVNTANLLMCK